MTGRSMCPLVVSSLMALENRLITVRNDTMVSLCIFWNLALAFGMLSPSDAAWNPFASEFCT